MNLPEQWDERFATDEFIYGLNPNQFFKDFIDSHDPGKLLLPAEGEGRHALYAASKGWEVVAFDFSNVARRKALDLALRSSVSVDYHLLDLATFATQEPTSSDSFLVIPDHHFDLVALLSVHMAPEWRTIVHHKAIRCLKPGGYLLLEAFNKKQIKGQEGERLGGPKDVRLLFSEEELATDFQTLEILELREFQDNFKAGIMHHGPSERIRFLGVKK